MQRERTSTKPQWFLLRSTTDGKELYGRTNCWTFRDAAIIAILRWSRLTEQEQKETTEYYLVYGPPYGTEKIEPDWKKVSKCFDLLKEIRFFEKHGPLTDDEAMGRKEIL